MTFPFVITATALLKSLRLFTGAGWAVPSWLFALQHVETTFAFVMVMYVMFRFAKQAIDQWRRTGRVSGV
ncbi:MAG: hypothetical protein L0J14_02550 [Bifidobacterium crudilactis]|jgi:exfoliative toxin A/B|nr:hypothetical protein [Bifidobacterium crudilactis]